MKLFAVVILAILVGVTWAGTSEEEGKKFIEEVNKVSVPMVQDLMAKQWAADTADKAHQEKATKEADEASKKIQDYKKSYFSKLVSFPWRTFKDPVTKYLFLTVFYSYGIVLPANEEAKYKKIMKDIAKVSETTLLKEYKSTDNKPKLKPADVSTKADKDYKNADEMKFYWKEYHTKLGEPVKNLYTQLVPLENENAHLMKYSNAAVSYETTYEIEHFEHTMLDLYKQIEPLYKELHAYIRYKLWVAHGKKDNIVDPKGPISASHLGSSWGEDASLMYSLVVPYPKKQYALDISAQLKAKGYTSKKMAQVAEQFYVSLGLSKMPADFWEHSIFEKKKGMNCTPSAYDFSNGKNYRVVFCADLNSNDFAQMHEYLADLEYGIETTKLPYLFQGEKSYVFNLAFDGMIQGFALSPDYLKSLGLLDAKFKVDKELLINALLSEALSNVFFLPYAYSLDLWRWQVFKGVITPQNYNAEYWKIRKNLQGIEPPVDRDENDFDVGADTWFITGGNYMTYYIANFLSYDMVCALCKDAGYYDPKTKPNNYLKFCDIHNNKAAGEKIKEMMELGSSQPWYEALAKFTGKEDKKLDGSGLLEYYQPLFQWLQEENKKNKVTVGWNAGHSKCQ